MGKNNRSRRAAKAKKRRQEARRRTQDPVGNDHCSPPPLGDGDLIMTAVHAERVRDVKRRGALIDLLVERPHRQVAAELQRLLAMQVPRKWEGGWQPADVMRLAARQRGDCEVDLMRSAIAADAGGYEQWGAAVAPEWMAQLREVGAWRWWDPAYPWSLQVQGAWREVLVAGIRLLDLLGTMPQLPVLTPPPSLWPTMASSRRKPTVHLDAGILTKVRALLAKAESTTFDAEAESFTAKAQELMTRHRIDRATVAHDYPVDYTAIGRRVGIDNPYPEAKSALLAGIADANGCRAVWSKDLGFVTIFGYPEELEGVEELFTSLLVQATAALQREGSKIDRLGRSRTTRFRRSFLAAFAGRIAQRLHDTTDETVRAAEVERGTSLLPELADRARAADEAVARAFPDTGHFSVSATDGEGYRAGIRFGDEADLTVSSPTRERTLAQSSH